MTAILRYLGAEPWNAPSWSHPIARSKGESAEPDLWPDYAWVPALGATGLQLMDVTSPANCAAFSGTPPSWTVSENRYALSFNFGSHVQIPKDPLGLADRFSICMWVKGAPGGNDAILSNWYTADANLRNILLRDDGSGLDFFIRNTGGTQGGGDFGDLLFDAARFVFFCAIYTGSALIAYKNGRISTSNHAFTGQVASGDLPRIGGGGGFSDPYFAGLIGDCLIYRNRVLDNTEIARLHADPYCWLRPRRFLIQVTAGPEAFLIDADPGSWQIGGSDSGLFASRIVAALSGQWEVTGAGTGTFARRQLAAQSAVVGVTGSDAAAVALRRLGVDPGSWAISGAEVSARASRRVDADPAGIGITGAPVAALAFRRIVAEAGGWAITGADAALDATLTDTVYTLAADAGVFALSGLDAGMIARRVLAGESGSLSWAGSDLTPALWRRLVAEAGGVVLSGSEIGTLRDRVLDAGPTTVLIEGESAAIIAARILAVDPGLLGVTGELSALSALRRLVADPGSFDLTGVAAVLYWSAAPEDPIVVRMISVAISQSRMIGVSVTQPGLTALGLSQSGLNQVTIH